MALPKRDQSVMILGEEVQAKHTAVLVALVLLRADVLASLEGDEGKIGVLGGSDGGTDDGRGEAGGEEGKAGLHFGLRGERSDVLEDCSSRIGGVRLLDRGKGINRRALAEERKGRREWYGPGRRDYLYPTTTGSWRPGVGRKCG
jgi:hypothetical protein